VNRVGNKAAFDSTTDRYDVLSLSCVVVLIASMRFYLNSI
jgi:hypothetical protein